MNRTPRSHPIFVVAAFAVGAAAAPSARAQDSAPAPEAAAEETAPMATAAPEPVDDAAALEAERQDLEQEDRARRAAEYERSQAAANAAPATAPPPSADAQEATGLDARLRRLSDKLARAIKALPGDHRDQTFTVVPLEDVGPEAKNRQLGLVVADILITNLARDHRIPLTERSQLDAILAEQELGALGAVEADKAAELGKLAGARGIILGEVLDAGQVFKVNVRIVDTETAQMLTAEEMDLPKEELIAVSANAVVLKSKAGATFRSAVAPGWGQVYNGEPVKAGIVGGAVGGAAAITVLTLLAAVGTHAAYATVYSEGGWSPEMFGGLLGKPNKADTTSNLRAAANLQYGIALLLAGVTGALWGGGVADAYISGTDVDSLDDALATN